MIPKPQYSFDKHSQYIHAIFLHSLDTFLLKQNRARFKIALFSVVNLSNRVLGARKGANTRAYSRATLGEISARLETR